MWLWVGKCPSNAFKKTTASHIGLVAVFFCTYWNRHWVADAWSMNISDCCRGVQRGA